jgi:RNA polymerase sigma-70 factor (ECF subfamily)
MPARATRPTDTRGDAAERPLVARLKQREEGAFEELVRLHYRRLHRTARRILDSEADADDAVQQSLLLAYRGLPRFREESRLTTWLYRIVTNAALSIHQQRLRRRETSIESLARPLAQDLRDADARILRWQLAGRFGVALRRLSPGHRRVLELDLAGLDTQDAAAALGITPSVLKLRRFRARRALRTVLESGPALGRCNGGLAGRTEGKQREPGRTSEVDAPASRCDGSPREEDTQPCARPSPPPVSCSA